MSPRIVGERERFNAGERFRVLEREIEHPSGERATYWMTSTRRWSAVLAYTPEGEVPLVRQYRPALARAIYELPAGAIDAGERAASAAVRELAEETGYRAQGEPELLGVFASSPGSSDAHGYVWLCRDVLPGEPRPEAGEHLDIHLVSVADLERMILSGEFFSACHVAGVLIALRRGLLPTRGDAGTASKRRGARGRSGRHSSARPS